MKAGRGWDVWLSPFAWDQVPPSNGDLLFETRPETVAFYLKRNVEADWTLHDLRRTGASRMAAMGVAPHVVSACLAHAVGSQADQHYLHGSLYQDERRAALATWGELLSAVGGSPG